MGWTWQEVWAHPAHQAAVEARHFLANQPRSVRFLGVQTGGVGNGTVGLAVAMAPVVIRSLEAARGAPIAAIPPARLALLQANLGRLDT